MEWHWFHLLIIPGLIVGFTVHELGHALTAYYLGDYSQVKAGRITANPFKHISWFGTALFLFFGIGWPKPINFNPQNFRNRYLDSFLVAIAGPVANFAICLLIFLTSGLVLFLLTLTGSIPQDQLMDILLFSPTALQTTSFSEALPDVTLWVVAFSNRIGVANFILALVSLVPLPPFDGFTAVLSIAGIIKEKRINDLTQSPTPSSSHSTTATAPSYISPSPPVSANPQLQRQSRKKSMADIHFQLGAEYHQQQKFDDAIARYRQAISVDASHGPAYVNMGLAYKAKNQRAEAIQALRAATKLATDDKSKNQAWAELHDLSALPNMPPTKDSDSGNSGEVPWTDTKPSPDWLSFWAGIATFLLTFICIFGVLILSLIGS